MLTFFFVSPISGMFQHVFIHFSSGFGDFKFHELCFQIFSSIQRNSCFSGDSVAVFHLKIFFLTVFNGIICFCFMFEKGKTGIISTVFKVIFIVICLWYYYLFTVSYRWTYFELSKDFLVNATMTLLMTKK